MVDYKSHPVDHVRRESELSAPVSDYEYFQFSPAVARPPPTPSTPGAPPVYTGAQSPVSPPLGSNDSRNSYAGGSDPAEYSATYPEVVPAGHQIPPEVPQYQRTPDHGEKEAYVAPKTYHRAQEERPLPPETYQNVREEPTGDDSDHKRVYPFGVSKKSFYILLGVIIAIILIIAVGVGAGVGVGTAKKHKSTSASNKDPLYAVGGAYDPAYFSKDGAFNGTGVALADVNFGLDNSIYVFYQSHTGDIEQLIYEADGSWNFVTRVAGNARNGTPLSTVAYIVDNVATWHLFYISKDNVLRQRVQTNSSQFQTNIWEDGPMNDLNLHVYDGDTVGMQACYWGNYYGSLENYNGASFLPSNSTATIGMNIWYADTSTSFQQYDWTNGQSQWNHTRTWSDMNGHAGVGCQSWLSNTTSYVFMVDIANSLNIYWKDINTNLTSTDTHPVNTYTKAAGINITNVHPSTSLGYTDFMIYQTLDGAIHGVNVTWQAEDTVIAPAKQSTSGAPESVRAGNIDGWALQPQDRALGGTHMAITGSTPASGGRQELLFYQAVGNDLRLGKRDADGGDFSFISVPLESVKDKKAL